jgi:NAD(P)-dependent dehydrogenase (short-subunit alcohol dehydrogenase family)
MMKNEKAVIDGAGGAVGGAVDRAFAREGMKDILFVGRVAEAPEVDAVDAHAVDGQI